MNLRLQAAEQGHKTYTAAKPCKQGHAPERYTSNGMCVECTKNHAAKFKVDHRAQRIHANLKKAHILVDTVVTMPHKYKHSTIAQDLNAIMSSGEADQFVTWVHMMAARPMSYAQLQPLMDWRDNRVHVDYMTFPQRHDDAGTLQIELTPGCWYVGDEVMRVLRGELDHCCRVWDN